MYVNQYDTTQVCGVVGKTYEDLFEEYLISSNHPYRPATIQEQFNHIDFVVVSKYTGEDVKIDVKAPKKVNRNDTSYVEEIVWVEFVNVRGDKGWLYGECDLIAFYSLKDSVFYIVQREDLANFCEKACDNKRVFHANEALYHKYTRNGRKDVISMIKMSDIKGLRHMKADPPNKFLKI